MSKRSFAEWKLEGQYTSVEWIKKQSSILEKNNKNSPWKLRYNLFDAARVISLAEMEQQITLSKDRIIWFGTSSVTQEEKILFIRKNA